MSEITSHPEGQPEVLSSRMARITALFTSPGAAFASINRKSDKGDWLIPLLIVAAVMAVTAYITLPATSEFVERTTRAQMEQNPNMSAEQREQAIAMVKRVGGVGAVVGAPISLIALAFLQALVLWGLGNLLLGGSATYHKSLCVVAYSGLVQIPAAVVTAPLVLAKGTPVVMLGLGLLLPESMDGGFLAGFLGMLNVFAIWQYALIAIGLSVIGGISSRKSFIGVFAILILFAAAMAALMPKPGM